MSKNILRDLLASRPVRTGIEFGIHENVRLIKVDNTPRKRDGEVIQKNTYLTFAKYNSKDEVIAQTEFSYFNLKHDSDYVSSNLSTQLAQLINIINVLAPDHVQEFTDSFNGMYDSPEDFADALGKKSGVKTIMQTTYELFEDAIIDQVGPKSDLLRLKVITDRKTGKYVQLSDDATIVESMETPAEDSVLAITAYERSCKAKALEVQTETADAVGLAPNKATAKSSVIDI